MNGDNTNNGQFWPWCLKQAALVNIVDEAVRLRAAKMLAEDVNSGFVTAIDGVDSPTSREMRAHHSASDFEMNSNWMKSSQSWTCPCCSRSKFQISRLGKKRQIVAKLVVHHDHMGEAMQEAFHEAFVSSGMKEAQVAGNRLVEHIGVAFAAYEETLICEDCNNADTEAKKQIKSPKYFSFSVRQIKQFIRSQSHSAHTVDALKANEIWQRAKSAYDLRMQLIQAVAQAAATDAHWYEPYERDAKPVPILGQRSESLDDYIHKWVSTGELFRLLGPKYRVSEPNLSRWRLETKPPGKPLPENFLAMLRSEKSKARMWDSLPDNWVCPVCARHKNQIVSVDDSGRILLALAAINVKRCWDGVTTMCAQCRSTLTSLKAEVSKLAGVELQDIYSVLPPTELSGIIIGRPHSSHQIKAKEATVLVSVIVRRLLGEA